MKTTRAFKFIFTLLVLHGTLSGRVVQLAELAASDGAVGDQFGPSLAISGDTIAVGTSPFFTPETGVYVFTRSGSSWAQVAKLTDGVMHDGLGGSVAIGGNTIVAGAPGTDESQGAASVFLKPAGGWRDMTPTAQLSVPPMAQAQKFGLSVAISGDGTTVVGGAEGDCSCPGEGAVYVFVKPQGGWQTTNVPTATLSSSSAVSLGNSVAISGDGKTVAAGSIGEGSVGLAYVFTMLQAGWQNEGPVATLSNSDQGFEDAFAYSIAVNPTGSAIAVGDPGKAVYVFVRPSRGWRTMKQTAELTVVAHEVDTRLGWSVALVGNAILAGAPSIFIGHSDPGAAFGYVKPPGGWVNTSQPNLSVTSSDGASKDGFGSAVAPSGNFGVVGAPGHAVNGNAEQGAAYVFGP